MRECEEQHRRRRKEQGGIPNQRFIVLKKERSKLFHKGFSKWVCLLLKELEEEEVGDRMRGKIGEPTELALAIRFF